MVLAAGGTLYVDEGKPAPGLIEKTAANLREIAPTAYFNVPRGLDMLLPLLREDAELRANFFSRLKMIFYAGTALPPHLWQGLEELSAADTGSRVFMTSSWGATETAPLVTSAFFDGGGAGNIGLPVPGAEMKLVPSGGKLEVRVRGPMVTPGYFDRPELTKEAFDEEGFYCIGDAVRFADPSRPEKGLLFDGRIAEDFKLLTGSWVYVGALRTAVIAALDPIAQDCVPTGEGYDEAGLLVFANVDAARKIASLGPDVEPERVLAEPPQIDASEITDKG